MSALQILRSVRKLSRMAVQEGLRFRDFCAIDACKKAFAERRILFSRPFENFSKLTLNRFNLDAGPGPGGRCNRLRGYFLIEFR